MLVLVFGVGILFWLRRRGGGTAVGPEDARSPEETFEGAQVYEGPDGTGMPPPPVEGETWEGARVHESVEPLDAGATKLGPQPEPPDMPVESGDSGYRGTPEDPAPGTGVYHPPWEGATELSPQPEQPDMPADTMKLTGEGATELNPPKEPPDHPVADGGPPEPDSGYEYQKGSKLKPDPGGDEPTGEPL